MRYVTGWTRVGADALLQVEALSVELGPSQSAVQAVRAVSFTCDKGDRLAIVGESGAGKSQLALAIAGLSPPTARVSGRVLLQGQDIASASVATRRQARARIGMVFQDPQSALTPHLRIGTQLIEALRVDQRLTRAEARERAELLLREVQIPDAAVRMAQFPYELSGGLKQRVLIAIALSRQPQVLLLDEPTTALDVTIAASLIQLFEHLSATRALALVLITHDLAVVRRLCTQTAVMFGGKLVEQGPTQQLLDAPLHPYTSALVAATLSLDERSSVPLHRPTTEAEGSEPMLGGCSYRARCPHALAVCTQEIPRLNLRGERAVACHALGELERAS